MRNPIRPLAILASFAVLFTAFNNCTGSSFKSAAAGALDASSTGSGGPAPTPGPKPVSTPSTITHGSELTLAMVGPSAIGITPTATYAGASLNDGQTYAFAKQIPTSATYDGFNVSGPHLLIEGVKFTSTLDIYTTQTVVVRGCSFRFPAVAANVMVRQGAGHVYLLYNDAGSSDLGPHPGVFGNTGTNAANDSNSGLSGDASAGTIFYRNHVSAARIGIQPGSGDQVIENYIDNFVEYTGDHIDGIMIDGTTNNNIQVLRNKVLVNEDQTCALCIMPDFANATDIVADSNYLAGGAYAIYGGQNNNGVASGIQLTNNVMGTDFYPSSGQYGWLAYWAGSGTGSGNYWCNNTLNGSVLINWPNNYPAGPIPTADCSKLP